MKELFLGIVLIIVLGLGGFLYRNTMEQPYQPDARGCQLDAKLCPDGTSVGREGPECSFAECPLPNFEIYDAQVAFVLPPGYVEHPTDTRGKTARGYFEKPSLSPSVSHTIYLNQYEIPEGQTGDDVILTNTYFQPADMAAADFSRFKNVTIAGRTYRTVVIERFEALVMSSYFLVRERDVLRFDIVEHDVVNWMDPNLVVEDLPEHRALRRMLETLKEY